MNEQHSDDTLRTSDSELLSETMPQSVEEQKQKILAESDFSESHGAHLERGYQIAEIKESLISAEITAEQTQQAIDETKEAIAIKEQNILTRVFEFIKVIKLKQQLSSSEGARNSQQEGLANIKAELSKLESLHKTEKAQLDSAIMDFMGSSEVSTEATGMAVEAKRAELESIRTARDVSAMCERENCLVFHTLMPKGYFPGTTLKTAPTDNSPLNYEGAVAGGVRLTADIALGYDIELSCSTIREGTKDSIWPGGGGFIIDGGSVRMAADQDIGSRVDMKSGRRYRSGGGASGSAMFTGRKDNMVRSEDDLNLAVTGPGRELPNNHNELVVESPDFAGMFVNIPSDARVIFRDESMGEDFIQEDVGHTNAPYLAESTFQDIIDIAKQNELPLFAIYKGEAYKTGPVVQRITTRGAFGTPTRLPFKEITLIPGAVPFEEIRDQQISITEEQKQAAKSRVPQEVFK